MSQLERLAGSLLCVGIPGGVARDEWWERLRRLRPGGVLLFAPNVSSLPAARKFVAALREALDDEVPLSVCVDQEGGRVARIPADLPMPSAMALGAGGDPALARRTGAALGSTVRAAGANVNLAPVLDLALDPDNTVIGDRSLGDDPAAVALLGTEIVRGLHDAGVAAVPKHFPGHGATPLDSHAAEPTVVADAATLRRRELIPFQRAFAAGARAVMTAHVSVPAFGDDLPATLSPRILRDVLRGELGFDGAIWTDCLEMASVAVRCGGTAGAGVRALAAGADVLLVSHDISAAEALRSAIVAAVSDGELPIARVEEAAQRVRRFREALREEPVESTAAAGVAGEVAARGVAAVRGDLHVAAERPVTVVSFEGATADGVARTAEERPSLSHALRRRGMRSESLRVTLDPDEAMIEQLAAVVGTQRAQGPRTVILLTRRAHHHRGQRDAIERLLAAAPDAVAVSVREPFDLWALRRAERIGATFGDERSSIEALADVLVGRIRPSARVPIARARWQAVDEGAFVGKWPDDR